MNAALHTELNRIFADILKETGTQVSLSSFGEEETAFSFTFCGESLTAYMRGKGEETEGKIKLVRYMLAAPLQERALPKEDSLKEVLLGEGGEWQAFRFMTKHAVKDGKCFAADVVPDKRYEETFRQLLRFTEGSGDKIVRMDERRIAVVRFLSEDQTPLEYAQFLFQALYEELGVRASVGVGCEADSFVQIASSYAQAVTAVRLSGIFHSKGEVHSYREYLLVTMLSDVPETRLKEYLAQFRIEGTEEVFSDPELAGTAEGFLENSLNLSETSRTMFVHRNTLMYRLDKIQRITGLDLKNFSDAVTFRVISVLHKLLK